MKKYFVGFGLNKINPHVYGTDGKLAGCHNDITDLEGLLKRFGFESAIYFDENATVLHFTQEINDLAFNTSAGDIVFIARSGNGTQVPDQNGDEPDKLDEAAVFYDGLLLDDRIHELLCQFKKGVRVFFYSDTCFSATAFRELGTTRPKSIPFLKGMEPPICVKKLAKRSTLKADVFSFSACRDNETAGDGERNGIFTAAFLTEMKDPDSPFTATWPEFMKSVSFRCRGAQHPVLTILGSAAQKKRKLTIAQSLGL